MKFLIDMPLSPVLAKWLAEHGHDAIHAVDLGLESAPDHRIIERAKEEQRTIITADLDYPRLLALAGAAEPSLILFRGGNWSDAAVIAKVSALLESLNPAEIEQSIFVTPISIHVADAAAVGETSN